MQTTVTTEKIIALIKLGDLMKKEVDKYSAIGYICIDGFNQKEDFKDNSLIYTYHYVGAHAAFDKKDVKKIVSYFQ